MKQFSLYRLFEKGTQKNRGKIDRNFNSCYSILFVYTYALTEDKDESRNIVKSALAEGCKVEDDLDSYELIEFLFYKVDAGIDIYYAERPQMQKIRDLLNDQQMKIRKYITKQDLLRAFQDEVENLPRERKHIFSLFFCGLSAWEVAKTVGQSKQIVLEERNKAIEEILNALVRRGFIFIDGQGY